MTVKLIGSSPSVTEKELDGVEAALGLRFPGELRDMLLKNNGGVLDNDRCIYQNEHYEYDIKYFLPVLHVKSDGIMTAERLYTLLSGEKKLIPENMLPFAIDGGGFPFCINMTDGSVHFISLESQKDNYLEPNLDDFISRVVSEEDAWG